MSSRNVIIYEQDHHNGASLRDLLATWGYEAVVAENISAALKAVSELRPTLIVDNTSTKLTNDSQLVREIRAQDVDLPVVLLAEPTSPESLA